MFQNLQDAFDAYPAYITGKNSRDQLVNFELDVKKLASGSGYHVAMLWDHDVLHDGLIEFQLTNADLLTALNSLYTMLQQSGLV